MTLTLPPELEHRINDLIVEGGYPNADAVLADAVESLVRERERLQVESVFDAAGLRDAQLETLLTEAENSGPFEEMTAHDWLDIEQDFPGMPRLQALRWLAVFYARHRKRLRFFPRRRMPDRLRLLKAGMPAPGFGAFRGSKPSSFCIGRSREASQSSD
jgi:Arc/MetJ-type ribon-helix-helix transcriptional regulator